MAETIMIAPGAAYLVDTDGDADAVAQALDGWQGVAAKALPDGRVAIARS